MKKCEVLVDRVSLVVSKGSIVIVDDRQYEIAKGFLKPTEMAKEVKHEVKEVREDIVEEQPLEKEEKPKRRKKK